MVQANKKSGYLDEQIGANVQAILDERGIVRDRFAKTIGLDGSQFRRLTLGEERWNSWHLDLVSRQLNVSPADLVEGRPRNIVSTAPQNLVIQQTERFRKYAETHPISKEQYIPIRLVEGRVAAGAPAQVREDEIEGWVLIYADREWIPNDPEQYTCSKIAGHSMSPVLQPGDIVAIDHAERDPETLNGKMVAFRIDGGVTVKWLKYDRQRHLVIGIPENKDELDYLVTLKGEEINTGIVGKIAWWWAKR